MYMRFYVGGRFESRGGKSASMFETGIRIWKTNCVSVSGLRFIYECAKIEDEDGSDTGLGYL